MEYKNCFVPSCKNDTENSPDKLFVQIRPELLKQWCEAADTEYFNLYTIYCCEDHFDPEKDLKNFCNYKKRKITPVLKPTAKLRYITKLQPEISPVKSNSASTTSEKVSTKSELEQPDLQPTVHEHQPLLTPRKRKKNSLYASGTRPKHANPAMSEFSQACRCCLLNVGTMKPLFGSSLDAMLADLMGFPIKRNDGYPQQICMRCVRKLSSAYNFYQTINKSHRTVEEKCAVIKRLTKREKTKAFSVDFPKEDTVAVACQTEEKLFQRLMLANVQLSKIEPDDSSYEMPEEEYVMMSENECEEELPETKYAVITERIETYEELPEPKHGYKCPQCLHVSDSQDELKGSPQENRAPPKNKKLKTRKEAFDSLDAQKEAYGIMKELKHVGTHVSDAAGGGEDTTPAHLCNICGTTFKCRTSLYKHLRFHGGHIFQCKYCDKQFAEQSTLKVHLISHSLTNAKPFDCELCERSFSQKAALRKHERSMHATERPVLRCKQCESTFLYKISLNKHCLRHHSKTHCNLCDSEFSGLKALEAHLKTHKQNKALAYEEAEYLEFDVL